MSPKLIQSCLIYLSTCNIDKSTIIYIYIYDTNLIVDLVQMALTVYSTPIFGFIPVDIFESVTTR